VKLLEGLLASFLGFIINILPNELAKSSLSSQMYDTESLEYDNLSSYALIVCDVSRWRQQEGVCYWFGWAVSASLWAERQTMPASEMNMITWMLMIEVMPRAMM
jgi:hypothetical protein